MVQALDHRKASCISKRGWSRPSIRESMESGVLRKVRSLGISEQVAFGPTSDELEALSERLG
jgi:hypothetical protein